MQQLHMIFLDRLKQQHKYLLENNDTYNNDLPGIIDFCSKMKLVLAGDEEITLLQKGVFFDGETLYYSDDVYELNDEELFRAIFDQVLHFLLGAHFRLGCTPTQKMVNQYLNSMALAYAHFELCEGPPKYANSNHSRIYREYYLKHNEEGTINPPHTDTGRYFWEKMYDKGINLITPFSYTELDVLEVYNGEIIEIQFMYCLVKKNGGLLLPYRDNLFKHKGEIVLYFLYQDGKKVRVSHNSKESKDLRTAKKILEKLS